MSKTTPKIEIEKIKAFREVAALNDQELVDACNSGNKEAWNEFFIRFGPLLREAIIRVINSRTGYNSFASEYDDTVSDIRVKIVKKLYTRGGLAECRDTRGIRPWLRTVATNQARDWFKRLNTEEKLPDKEAGKDTVSLDEPMFGDCETTRVELIEDCGTVTCKKIGNAEDNLIATEESEILGDLLQVLARMQEIRNFWMMRLDDLVTTPLTQRDLRDLERVSRIMTDGYCEDIGKISAKITLDQRKYWILRLSILATELLAPQETEELAGFCRIPINVVREKIEEITRLLAEKIEEKESELGKAELYRCQLMRLERRRHEAECKGAEADVERLEDEIAAKSKKRVELIRKGSKLPRPSNKDIALLVGLPEVQEGQVTTILTRVQERIWQGWKQALRDRERGKTDIDLIDYLYL